jgi:broad specificity phosphatase PhoE
VSVIHLVRHAQASWGSQNYDQLSEQGYLQGATLGRSWADAAFAPQARISGSLQRHRQTAECALAAAGLPLEIDVDADWNEIDTRELMVRAYPDFDASQSQPRDAAVKDAYLDAFIVAVRRWTAGRYDDDYTMTFRSFIDKVTAALDGVAERLRPDTDAVVFTSGGPVSACAAALLGDPALLWPQFCTTVVNASVTKVVVTSNGLRLLSFNEHAHLGEFTYI